MAGAGRADRPERKPPWGYRRAHGHLRENGWPVNRKRVQRLWREEGLRVPQKTRKRRRTGDPNAKHLRAERPNQLWALDYQYDQTADGRMLHLLTSSMSSRARRWPCTWIEASRRADRQRP